MILTADNLRSFAATHYQNNSCLGMDEFIRDLSIPTLITTHIRKVKQGRGNIRILINHLITFLNVFDTDAAKQILFFVIPEESHPELKTLLSVLNRIRTTEYINIPIDHQFKNLLIDEFRT